MKNYVKVFLGHDVPEGATDVSDFQNPQPVEFYRIVNGIYQYFNVGNNNPAWCKSVFNEPNKYAIPLPEEPMPSKAEWVNGVPDLNSEVLLEGGEEYLFSASSNEMFRIAEDEVLIVVSIGARHDNGNPVVTVMAKDSKNISGYVTVNPDFLSPLKTEEEKKREAFVEDLVKVLNSVPNGTSLSDLHAMAEKAYDAGFTAPEGE